MVLKRPMVAFLTQLLLAIRSRFIRRARLEAENLILRQQLIVLRRKSPTRVKLRNFDRLLLAWLYRLCPSLLNAIIIVQPETVIRWHRRGFRAYWRWKSRRVGGRPGIDCEMHALDFVRRVSHRSLRSVGADWKRLFILSDGAISADWVPPMVIIAERRSTWLVASGRSRLSSLRRFLCGWNFEYTQGSNRVAGKNADSRLLA
jgi:hypothetical protein